MPSSGSISRSCGSCTSSRRRRKATAPRSASSCCTVRWAHPRARLRGSSSRVSSNTPARLTARSSRFDPWVGLGDTGINNDVDIFPSPMNEEPLLRHPAEVARKGDRAKLGLSNDKVPERIRVEGDLDPASRFIFKALMQKYEGDWSKVVSKHVRVRRLMLSEKDRVGVGTFQPKDEKNQETRPSSRGTSTIARSPSTAATRSTAIPSTHRRRIQHR